MDGLQVGPGTLGSNLLLCHVMKKKRLEIIGLDTLLAGGIYPYLSVAMNVWNLHIQAQLYSLRTSCWGGGNEEGMGPAGPACGSSKRSHCEKVLLCRVTAEILIQTHTHTPIYRMG